jgi:hypothetical protein
MGAKNPGALKLCWHTIPCPDGTCPVRDDAPPRAPIDEVGFSDPKFGVDIALTISKRLPPLDVHLPRHMLMTADYAIRLGVALQRAGELVKHHGG